LDRSVEFLLVAAADSVHATLPDCKAYLIPQSQQCSCVLSICRNIVYQNLGQLCMYINKYQASFMDYELHKYFCTLKNTFITVVFSSYGHYSLYISRLWEGGHFKYCVPDIKNSFICSFCGTGGKPI
jgi:hypothetical protein